MASGQSGFSVRDGHVVGQAQMKREDHESSQASGFLQQKEEQVKSMAQGATEAVKNTLGLNHDNDTDYKNKNPLDRKNPNNTTSPSMPGLPPSDI